MEILSEKFSTIQNRFCRTKDKRIKFLEKEVEGWRKLWAQAQNSCARHARRADGLEKRLKASAKRGKEDGQ